MNLKEAEEITNRTRGSLRGGFFSSSDNDLYWKAKGVIEGHAQGVEEERAKIKVLIQALEMDSCQFSKLALEAYKSVQEK
jgi:hypothetical protein